MRQTSDAVSVRPPLTRADAVVLIGSPLLFVGLLAWAHLLQSDRPAPLLTRSTVMALSWLAVGPCLLWDAVRISQQFVWSHRSLMRDAAQGQALLSAHLRRLAKGWLFGVPWSLAVTTLVVQELFPGAPWAEFVWVVVSFGLLFLISGFGFWGVGSLIVLVRDFANAGLEYRPYHPDRFGGMAAVGGFAARGAFYFSSGALVLPMAFDVIDRAESPTLPYLVTAVFLLFVVVAFVVPVIEIKRVADGERVRVTLEARDRLARLMEEYATHEQHDEKLARRIEMCFEMECAELEKLRAYPYDLRVGVELTLAIAVPIGVVLLERQLG